MEPLLTPAETAEILRLKPKTLRNMRTRGGGPPAVKVGTAVRYRRADLERWLDSRTQDRTPAPARRRAS